MRQEGELGRFATRAGERSRVTGPLRRAAAAATLAAPLLFGSACAWPATRTRAAAERCALPDAERRWIQEALDGWERVSRDFLRLDAAPLPWMILFGRACAWHLAPDSAAAPGALASARPVVTGLTFAGAPVPGYAVVHRDSLRLPDGRAIPARPTAYASLYRGSGAAFFVMALPSVWRTVPRLAADPNLEEDFLGVLAHEVTHTRQLTAITRQIRELGRRYTLPAGLNDDIIQQRFDSVPGFRAAYEAERDLLYRAALERDVARRRALAAQALGLMEARRARYFPGENAVCAGLEDVFLNMEGVGSWAAFALARARARARADGRSLAHMRRGSSDAEVLAAVRSGGRYWSQDEGLALFLVIDALVPGWQRRVLGEVPASVLDLLREAAGVR